MSDETAKPLHLLRVTTEYVEVEDRMRLSGASAGGQSVVIWLNRRLLRQLLRAALGWLEHRQPAPAHADLVHGFAQQVARAAQLPQPAVRADDAETWLAHEIDLALGSVLVMTFRNAAGRPATWGLEPTALRQWLGVVREADHRAQWMNDLWPVWLNQPSQSVPAQTDVLH